MKETLFDTKVTYKVPFPWKGLTITHYLNQPTLHNLHLFEIEKRDHTIMRGKEIQMASRSSAAFLKLWDLCIKKVEGYPFSDSKKWQEKVPAMHRLATIKVFNEVQLLTEQEVEDKFDKEHIIMDFEKEAVYLTAQQGGIDFLLVHVFKQPDAGDLEAWDRIQALGKMKITKNKIETYSNLTTKPLVNLYDALVIDVQGYKRDEGQKDDFSDIPPLHKEMAVKNLFRTWTEGIEEFEKN